MKKYRLLVTVIIAMGIILIGTSNPLTNLYKSTNLINKGINPESKEEVVGKEKIEEDKKFLICIDPGHQEHGDSKLEPVAPGSYQQKARVSSGATGVATKKPEYVLNLEASTVLKHILEGKGYTVMMTRETNNVNISNSERAIYANEQKADMVIRIHADSLDNTSKTGASILIPAKDNQYTSGIYASSNECAQLVKNSMEKSGIEVNGIFERGDLTGFNWSKVPVVLVEMGFLSNYNEDRMMSDPGYQRKLMQSIADGVEEYFLNK
ncbi:MAG: N-acetylmuramoyl-L-alanine amidase [Peptostreptococcaceae bacterium]